MLGDVYKRQAIATLILVGHIPGRKAEVCVQTSLFSLPQKETTCYCRKKALVATAVIGCLEDLSVQSKTTDTVELSYVTGI